MVRIGRQGHCGHYEQVLSGGGWVRARSLCVHLNPDSSAANRLGGPSTGGRPHEDSLVGCPRRDCAHGRQRPRNHEQCLQEQPSRMVRSNVRYPTPREDWAQLIAAPRTAPKYMAAVGDDVSRKFSLRPIIDGRTEWLTEARPYKHSSRPFAWIGQQVQTFLAYIVLGARGALVCCRPARAFPAQCEAWRTHCGHTLKSMICADGRLRHCTTLSELARRPFEINASPETKANFQPVPLRHPPLKRTYGLL